MAEVIAAYVGVAAAPFLLLALVVYLEQLLARRQARTFFAEEGES